MVQLDPGQAAAFQIFAPRSIFIETPESHRTPEIPIFPCAHNNFRGPYLVRISPRIYVVASLMLHRPVSVFIRSRTAAR